MKITVAFAGGGTGGHIYPGLAVADSLRELADKKNIQLEICWIGSSSGMDRNIVEKNFDANSHRSADVFYGIPAGKLRRYFSWQNFIDVFKILGGLISSIFILLKIKPAVLFSKGGFVSVPPCAAARLLGIPVFTHECDFTPGLATKLNSKFAKKIFVSYDETIKYLNASARKNAIVTGNPVRPVFYNANAERGKAFVSGSSFASGGGVSAGGNHSAGGSASASGESVSAGGKSGKPLLVVIGGSSGAAQINELVRENLSWLCERFVVVHQTGKNAAATKSSASGNSSAGENSSASESSFANCEAASTVAENYKPYEFIYSEMPDVLSAADVILSRAGANSLWECAVLGKPLVLIPLCGSGTRGDQEDNAKYFEERGAAIVLDREDATSENLQKALSSMLDAKKRSEFSAACGSLANGEPASKKIAALILNEINVGEVL